MSRPHHSAPRPDPDELSPAHEPLLRLLARLIVDDYEAELAAARAGKAEKSKASGAPLDPPAKGRNNRQIP
jgi:hypothetical protein